MDVSTSMAAVAAMKLTFSMLTSLSLTAYKFPLDFDVPNNTEYDYVVGGCGSGGSIIASRLSEDSNTTVVCIEAGVDPQWETQYAQLFPYLTQTKMDWNYTSENDNTTAQYHRNKYLDLPSGKVMGGSSSLHHFYYLRGVLSDYNEWATAAGDDAWTYDNILKYYKKFERLEDTSLMASETANFHGTDGLVGITRQLNDWSLKYLKAFAEVGYTTREDLNANVTEGFAQPMFFISSEGIRQSSAESYLSPAKNRTNLHIMKGTTVTKVLFDDNKNAIGVQCIRPDGSVRNIYAKKEVILSAGAFNTPKILMLSGIGPKDHLESLNITVLYDSPVGKNLKDHMAIVIPQVLGDSNYTASAAGPSSFPMPSIYGYGKVNVSGSEINYFTLNLMCPNNPSGVMLLCSSIFGLNDSICNEMTANAKNKEVLFTVLALGRPESSGKVLLRSANPDDPPKIYTGFLTNTLDIQYNIEAIKDFVKVNESSYYKSVKGNVMQLNLPNCANLTFGSDEYWKCYHQDMADTTFHYCCTASMGKVVDAALKVKGVNNLRVGDASAMPNPINGNINSGVMIIAEKLADLLRQGN